MYKHKHNLSMVLYAIQASNRLQSARLPPASKLRKPGFEPRPFKYMSSSIPISFTSFQSNMYADDLAIMSESPSGLQIMLGYLEEFCQVYMMEVNISKSVVLVFNTDLLNGKVTNKWEFKGQDLPIKRSFTRAG